MSIGEQIRERRNFMKLKQDELAISMGVSTKTIQRWESNQQSPRTKELIRLATVLHTTVAYLSGETDNFGHPMSEAQPLPESNVRIADNDIVWVPVVSNNVKVCCGDGNDNKGIDWDVIGAHPMLMSDVVGYSWQLRDGGYHIITVEGDSMEPKVHDGDRILIADVELMNGDLAVCLYRGRTMLRGVSFEKDGARLIPWNKEYSEIFVPKEDSEDLFFLGKMLGVVPQFQRLSSMI